MQREFKNTKVRNNKREGMEYEIFKLKNKSYIHGKILESKKLAKTNCVLLAKCAPVHVFELATKGVNITTLKQLNYPQNGP